MKTVNRVTRLRAEAKRVLRYEPYGPVCEIHVERDPRRASEADGRYDERLASLHWKTFLSDTLPG